MKFLYLFAFGLALMSCEKEKHIEDTYIYDDAYVNELVEMDFYSSSYESSGEPRLH